MLKGIIILWFLFVILSLVFTVYDIRNTPVSWVQKLGWIMVVFYTGPFGLFFYLLTCRSPGKDWHALYTQAQWKQTINSEVHCLAGDATGIIVAAILLSNLIIPMRFEVVIEYTVGFISGWFIFQAGMMRSMYNSYRESLYKTFFPEITSMNFMMLGMIPTMLILMHYIPSSSEPTHLHFWFVMGMATLVGGLTGYPINLWLVSNKLKHGCMTLGINDIAGGSLHRMDMSGDQNKMMMDEQIGMTPHSTKSVSFKEKAIITGMTFVLLTIVIFITLQFLPMFSMNMM